MSEPIRVPMPARNGAFVGEGDVAVSLEGPRIGRRFYMDVSEEVLAKVGGEALAHGVARLGESIAWSHRPQIDRLVNDKLFADHKWAVPIIEDQIRKSVHELLADMMPQILKDFAKRQLFWMTVAAINFEEEERAANAADPSTNSSTSSHSSGDGE